MNTRNITISFLLTILSCDKKEDTSIIEANPWKLKWSDEFAGPQINPENWVHELGDGTLYGDNPGWGNNQKQWYTADPSNSYIETDNSGNSVLVIEAIKNGTNPDYPYTSARMTTENLQTFRYGRIEARIKLPFSQGVWPAFWTLGSNKAACGWPGCGEIDIMEMLGNKEENITANLHYVDKNNNHNEDLGTSTIGSGKYSDDYHVYSIIWTPDSVTWFVDGKKYHEKTIEADMKEFSKSQFLILNLAVGGYWPGYPDETSVFPQKMYIDYVRVYEDSTLVTTPEVLDDPCEVMGGTTDIAVQAISSNFPEFNNVKIVSYGPGTSPVVSVSTIAVDGGSSVMAEFPGGNWGGIWFELDSALDMSSFSEGRLVVSLNIPPEIVNFEVKLESTGGVGSVNLLDYPSVPEDKGFARYTIPLADFVSLGLKLDKLTIPFALWNPKDANSKYVAGNVFIDKLYFE
jgi:beta-glucanase (GH16 family)